MDEYETHPPFLPWHRRECVRENVLAVDSGKPPPDCPDSGNSICAGIIKVQQFANRLRSLTTTENKLRSFSHDTIREWHRNSANQTSTVA
jgi:hypothetical protein